MNAAWDQVASMENAAPTAIYSLIQNEGECWFGTAFWELCSKVVAEGVEEAAYS